MTTKRFGKFERSLSQWHSRIFIALTCCFMGTAALAEVDFASEPLTVQESVPPNLLFILDDSGSMRWQFMPDALRNRCEIEGGALSTSSYLDRNLKDKPAYCQSPDYNAMYFNPDFTYEAPVGADGAPFPDAEPTAAFVNGFDDDSDTVNLNEWREGSSTGNGSATPGCEYLFQERSWQRQGFYCDCGNNCDSSEIEFVTNYQGRNLYRCLDNVREDTDFGWEYYYWRYEDAEFNPNYGGASSAGEEFVGQVVEESRGAGYYCEEDDVSNDTYICLGTPQQALLGDRYWLLEGQGDNPQGDPAALYADEYERDGELWWYCPSDDVEQAYTQCDNVRQDRAQNSNRRYWALDQSSEPSDGDLSIFYRYLDQTGFYCRLNDLEEVHHCRGEPQLYTGGGSSEEWWLLGYSPDDDDSDESLLCEGTDDPDPNDPSDNAFTYYRFWNQLEGQAQPPGCRSSEPNDDEDCYIEERVSTSGQLQNAANWFSYYRARILTAKTGVSLAFNELNTTYRVGYGSINSSNTIRNSLQPFADQRSSFYAWLQSASPSGGTPLRAALDDAGQYYSSDTPYLLDLTDPSSEALSCQQNFTVLMTDGYWNSSAADTSQARVDNDSVNGPMITSDTGKSFQFLANTEPFYDGNGNTLADVAMYYWKRDIKENLTNNLPVTDLNPAFWQHMVTLGISLGAEGDVDREDAFDAIDSGANINWGQPDSSGGPENIDDLLHAAVNSRGAFFSAKNPSQFITDLKAALGTVETRVASGTSPAVNTAQVSGDRLIYRATYQAGDWSGTLSAFGFDVSDGEIGARQWSESFANPDDRKIYTVRLDGVTQAGTEFTWNALDPEAQATFGSNDGGEAENIFNYLRGDRTFEGPSDSDLRPREVSIMGTIVNASPYFVGAPNSLVYRDVSWPEGALHRSFASTYRNRVPAVYTASNDGMLHAFHGNTGAELFAHMPRLSVMNGAADLADPAYEHRYLNDGPITVYDVYLGSTTGWRTILLGTFGRGGRGLYALDVTDPDNFDENSILWEISDTTSGSVGQILSEPTVSRLSDGTWVVLVGNGYNSDSEVAELLVIDIATGAIKTISTGVGGSSNSNGLAGPLGWDTDPIPDFNTDFAYAGDLLGNVWQFDLSAGFASLDTSQTPVNVFTAENDSGQSQPITGKMLGVADPDDQLWLFFGTGQLFNEADVTNTNIQSWYGLSVQAAQEQSDAAIERVDLKERSFADVAVLESDNTRFTALRQAEKAQSGDMNGALGWVIDFDLPSSVGERIISGNSYSGGAVIASTYIPIVETCAPGGNGYLLAVDPFTGAALEDPFFDLNNDNALDEDDLITRIPSPVIAGVSFGDVPSKPIFVEDQLVTQLEDGTLENIKTRPNLGVPAEPLKRTSWREIRE